MSSLSLLLEIFPSKSKLEITKALSNSNGSVERATECLLGSVESENSTKRLKIGLDSWLGVKQPKESKLKKPTVIKGNSKEGKETKLNAFDLLKPPIEVVSAPVAKMIEICTAEAVYDATNGLCTLIENILPKELAATLFLSSVEVCFSSQLCIMRHFTDF